MNRFLRNTVIQLKPEVTYGIDPGSWTAADALLISDAKFRIDRDVVPRNLIRGYLGGSEHLVGTRRAEINFTVELAGSGTAGTVPQWGKLLRMCGMAEVVTPGARVEYTPVSAAFESGAARYFIDGVVYFSRGVRGSVKLKLNANDRPVLECSMMGFDTNAIEAVVNASAYPNWKRPFVVSDANSGDIRIGGTYLAGNITGGQVLKSRGIEIDLGNKVSHAKLLGGEAIDIVDRDTSGKMSVELSAADEVTWRTDINANTLASVGFSHGVGAGNLIRVFGPSVQRIDPQAEDYEGGLLTSTELRFLPVNGNDELRIVAA